MSIEQHQQHQVSGEDLSALSSAHHASTRESSGRASKDAVRLKLSLAKSIAAQFDPDTSAALDKFISDICVRQRRAELHVTEREAIADVAAINTELHQMASLRLSKPSRRALLSDLFTHLLAAKEGRGASPITLLATTCPDYPHQNGAYLASGGLGTGTGLCAHILAREVAPLIASMAKRGVRTALNLSFADIEANDASMLKKSGLGRDEFLERVRQSRLAAEDELAGLFDGQGIAVNVRTSSMQGLIDAANLPPFEDLCRVARIGEQVVHGIAAFRTTFYERFFDGHFAAHNRGDFFALRARKDIADHFLVGQAVAKMRAGGEPIALLTLSQPALARFFNSGSSRSLPVVRIEVSY